MKDLFIQPNWPAPKNIKAYTTLRTHGVSQPPYDQLNLAEHVADNPQHVAMNRAILRETLKLPAEPIWINQTHSRIAIQASPDNRDGEADASFTDQPDQICVVLTADCLPILVCHRQGTQVAAIHAGWRGLLGGVIEATLDALALPAKETLIWLGPAISATYYEVGPEVRAAFLTQDPETMEAFSPSPNARWLADLYQLARIRLRKKGISAIYGGEYCTYSDPKRFYSYRRDGAKTGRFATLIYSHL